MKFTRQILLTAFFGAALALTASAQDRREEKKKPLKENAEIKAEENKKPKNNENRGNENRNNENRGRRPQTYFLLSENQIVVSFS